MLKILVVIFAFFSIGISSFHHHADGTVHLDCPVCFFQINTGASQNSLSVKPVSKPDPAPEKPQKKEKVFVRNCKKHYHQRTPPKKS